MYDLWVDSGNYKKERNVKDKETQDQDKEVDRDAGLDTHNG